MALPGSPREAQNALKAATKENWIFTPQSQQYVCHASTGTRAEEMQALFTKTGIHYAAIKGTRGWRFTIPADQTNKILSADLSSGRHLS